TSKVCGWVSGAGVLEKLGEQLGEGVVRPRRGVDRGEVGQPLQLPMVLGRRLKRPPELLTDGLDQLTQLARLARVDRDDLGQWLGKIPRRGAPRPQGHYRNPRPPSRAPFQQDNIRTAP